MPRRSLSRLSEQQAGIGWGGRATLMCHEKQTHQSKRQILEILEDAQGYLTLLVKLQP